MLILTLTLAAQTLDVGLAGVVLARSGRHAATLVAGGRSRSVLTGERAFGCEVVGITEDAVDLVCGASRRTLGLSKSAAAPTREEGVPGPVDTAPPPDLTLSRAELEARLDREMSRLMTETTLIPVTSRGQVAGFTLSRIPAGTILETLGLQAGDVLVSVNDTPIDSFTTLVGLWPRLQTSGAVRAQILRAGRPVDISVSIK